MKFWKQAASTMAATAVAGGLALAAAPAASAINQVDCGGRDDFYTITDIYRGSQCFANAGNTGTFQRNTRTLYTGNNKGNIYYYNYADGRNWYSIVRNPKYRGWFDYPFVNTLAVRIF
ncbi:hypothetical protein [Sinomonas sp. P47F7]|uniref:hypothetical protein n=1 Tax=Sinomonas sp. P47F7 TaxID=3410987 RepID=UPI003BF491AD